MECIFPFKTFPWALRGSPPTSLSHQSACWQKHLVPPNQCGSWRQSEELSGLPSTAGETSVTSDGDLGEARWRVQRSPSSAPSRGSAPLVKWTKAIILVALDVPPVPGYRAFLQQ
eukprot:2354502-Ditylum_brightwellii.AAC.1